MTLAEVMANLEAAGSSQTKSTYKRHGMPEPLFGVSYAHLGALRKRIKIDNSLALGLWATGNGDARTLAMMIADPKLATRAEIDVWADGLTWTGSAGHLADFVHQTPHAAAAGADWSASSDEWMGCAGWALLTLDAMREDDTPDAHYLPMLARIEAHIHGAKNRVRAAMMSTLIAIGARTDALAEVAIATAHRIGPLDIDHGDTACKSPSPEPYIRKMRANRTAKAERQREKALQKYAAGR